MCVSTQLDSLWNMADSRTKLAADAWGALLQVHAVLVPRIDRAIRRDAGLPLGWYDVLLELQAAVDGRQTMSELGQRVVLSRTRVSRVVDELAAEGLVRREPHPSDARSAYAVITDAGRDRFRRAAPVYRERIKREFAEGLTDHELELLVRALGKVRDRARSST
jgi:DNA-binding MarR family transcriptional regulator